MKNPDSFLIKNKKSLLIGSGIVILGGTAYAIFGYKGKDGKTAFQRWTKSGEERAEESGGTGGVPAGSGKPKPNVADLINKPIVEASVPASAILMSKMCSTIPSMNRAALLKALGRPSSTPSLFAPDGLLRMQLRQKWNCGSYNFSGAPDATLRDFILSQGKEINLFL